jgi:hypothetical protein
LGVDIRSESRTILVMENTNANGWEIGDVVRTPVGQGSIEGIHDHGVALGVYVAVALPRCMGGRTYARLDEITPGRFYEPARRGYVERDPRPARMLTRASA